MLSNESVPNEKPRDLAVTKPQSTQSKKYLVSNNSTTLRDSKSRYEKGMKLYRDGKVKVGTNGLFKVSGYYEADTEKVTCTCPDYKTRKEVCKHLFAAMLFVKNRGKDKIENLEGHSITATVKRLLKKFGKVTPSSLTVNLPLPGLRSLTRPRRA